ncbi:MAG: tetratricopeptide repeat protein [Leptonema sp. (in: bacteria)]
MMIRLQIKYLLIFFILILTYSNSIKGEEPIENQNSLEDLEEKPVSIEEIKENAKILECQIDESKILQFAILKNGEAYLISDGLIKKIPILYDINEEGLEIKCNQSEIIIISKMPLSNLQHKQVFYFENEKLERFGSITEDLILPYFRKLFEYVKLGQSELIIKEPLKEVNYSYQYINGEELEKYANELLEFSFNKDNNQKIKMYTAFGILTTKLILFYHSNVREFDSVNFEDFTLWMTLWEEVGWENYEKFLYEYAKTYIKKNAEKSAAILEELIKRKPDFLPPYLFVADFYWEHNQKSKAVQLYKTIIEKKENFIQDQSFMVPEYVELRIKNSDTPRVR